MITLVKCVMDVYIGEQESEGVLCGEKLRNLLLKEAYYKGCSQGKCLDDGPTKVNRLQHGGIFMMQVFLMVPSRERFIKATGVITLWITMFFYFTTCIASRKATRSYVAFFFYLEH